MNATRTSSAHPSVMLTLANLLERLEHSVEPVGAEQYRSVIRHLVQAFQSAERDPEWAHILNSYPATSELYENLHYAHAGLCRSALESSLHAELQAKAALNKARLSASTQSNQGTPRGED
jgi:hypothetical protein